MLEKAWPNRLNYTGQGVHRRAYPLLEPKASASSGLEVTELDVPGPNFITQGVSSRRDGVLRELKDQNRGPSKL